MDRPLIAPLPAVRALIARLALGDAEAAARVGAVTLHAHQRTAVARLRAVMEEYGGALLADEVGLGKTYVAATLAREFERVLVVAPATLREMWIDALRATHVRAQVVSYTSLSRGAAPTGRFDLLILDEAHHARTPGTIRYGRLAALTAGARVLLLSATPIHNGRRDLAALLALFLGVRAWTMSDDALARCIVRRERGDVVAAAVPALAEPRWLAIGDDAALLEAILALPPPLPPSDGGDAGALVAWSLARQWASSNGALVRAIRRRIVRAAALDAALADGRRLSRTELARWACSDRAIQLAFPAFVDGTVLDVSPAPLREALELHAGALHALLRQAKQSSWTDLARARALRDLRATHPAEKIVAFTQFADTVQALFHELRWDPAIAALTARGGTVAGGALSRRATIARFAPRASGAAPPRAADRIDLLLTTDLLSEGVNLHDASVVVHLDLPWTPARLEQRIGRSRRIGAPHARTAVYALAPPAASETLLRVEERLREKLRAAGRAVGMAGTILPAFAGEIADESAVRRWELVRQTLARWASAAAEPSSPPTDPHAHAPEPVIAGVRAPRDGVLALVAEGTSYALAASLDGAPLTDAPATLLDVVRLAGGAPAPAPLDDSRVARTMELVDRWITQRAALAAAGATVPLHAGTRRLAMQRIAAIAGRAPHHRRPAIAELAARARRVVVAPYGVGGEAALERLLAADLPDELWLRRLEALGHDQRVTVERRTLGAAHAVAIVVLQP